MPSNFNNLGDSALVFNTYHLFTVSLTGQVIELYKNRKLNIIRINNEAHVMLPGILLNRIETEIPVSLLNVVALAYKRPWFNLRQLGLANAIPIDGNKENIHPENLLWKYPDGGLSHELYNDLFYIPGFSRYVINKDGRVFNSFSLKEKQAHITKELYRSISITGEAGNSSRVIPVHRLLALAFVPYPNNVRDLVVNHKDLNRFNDSIDNLEWCTQSENIKHSYLAKQDLDTDNDDIKEFLTKYNIDKVYLGNLLKNKYATPVECKNLETGEIKEFISMNEAAKCLGVHPESVRNSFFRNGRSIVKRRYIFRKHGEQWPELTLEDVRLGYDGQARKVVVKDINSQTTKEYESAAEAIRTLGVSKKRVTKNLKLGKQVNIDSYVFQYKDKLVDWLY